MFWRKRLLGASVLEICFLGTGFWGNDFRRHNFWTKHMKRQHVSASDVAKMAGVSRTIVSFILNNIQGKHISEATRQRVLQMAETLEYVPDINAISLAKKAHYSIGFFIFY